MPTSFKISHEILDITNPPFEQAVIVHSCNCLGDWGAGVALALKKRFPSAYAVHEEYCKDKEMEELIGTCQLIRPQKSDYINKNNNKNITSSQSKKRKAKVIGGDGDDDASVSHGGKDNSGQKRVWIACIFTSIGYGRPNKKKGNPGKDKPDKILAQTRDALTDFRKQLDKFHDSEEHDLDERNAGDKTTEAEKDRPGIIVACKFNSGYFGVDWEDSEKVVQEVFSDSNTEWVIVDRDTQSEKGSKRRKT